MMVSIIPPKSANKVGLHLRIETMKYFRRIPLLALFLIIISSSCTLQKEETIDHYVMTPSLTSLSESSPSQSVQPTSNQNTPIPTDSVFAGSDKFGDGFIARIPIVEVEALQELAW